MGCKHFDKLMSGKCHPNIYKNKEKGLYIHACEELKSMYVPGFCEKKDYSSLYSRIIKLCTYDNCTPQGFPTSPYIANIVLRAFDEKMARIAVENNCVYTRYADDLSFSSKTMTADELRTTFKEPAQRTLWGFGFAVNHEKEQWKEKGRLKVCSIVVNEKLNISKIERRTFRAKVHKATVKCADRTTRKHIYKLKGWASYLMSVHHDHGKKYMDILNRFEAAKWPKAA